VQLEHGSTLRVYSVKHDPTSTLGTAVYPHSHLCKSVKYRKLSFQLAVSHQVGTVDSRADRNEQDNKSEALQGCRKKLVWKTTEDLEWIRGPRSSVGKCDQYCSRERPSIYNPHYVWSGFGGVISSTFPHATSCLSPVLEGGRTNSYDVGIKTLPISDSNVCFKWP
jgi:hypothetical protein